MGYKVLLSGLVFLVLLCGSSHAQQAPLYNVAADSTSFTLTVAGAEKLAELPLKCITQQFPNKTSHTSNGPADHVMLPHDLHPAFYGCFDWHSSVHGHWMLIKLLKQFQK